MMDYFINRKNFIRSVLKKMSRRQRREAKRLIAEEAGMAINTVQCFFWPSGKKIDDDFAFKIEKAIDVRFPPNCAVNQYKMIIKSTQNQN